MIVRTGLVKVVVKYEDATFNMKELPTDIEASIAVKGATSPGAALRKKFCESIESWSGIESEAGPIECNTKNKRIVFGANQPLVENVMKDYMEAIVEAKEEEKKISKIGVAGISEKEGTTATPANV